MTQRATDVPTGGSTMCAVIGRPVRHSLSPAIHRAAFRAAGLDWTFTRFEVVEGGVEAVIAAMPVLGIRGLAVTMPHKEAAATAVDEVDEAARALRSVNTITRRDDGSTLGSSTDGDGFVGWVEASDVRIAGARVVVLGAGAAGRSIVDALGRAGAAEIAVVNRTASAAQAAVELAPVARLGSVDDVSRADLLVNATSVGMGSDACPIDPSLLRRSLAVADIVYHPVDTRLLRAARRVGATAIDGLGMLVHQAVLQQRRWTGIDPDPALLRRAAERELARAR